MSELRSWFPCRAAFKLRCTKNKYHPGWSTKATNWFLKRWSWFICSVRHKTSESLIRSSYFIFATWSIPILGYGMPWWLKEIILQEPEGNLLKPLTQELSRCLQELGGPCVKPMGVRELSSQGVNTLNQHPHHSGFHRQNALMAANCNQIDTPVHQLSTLFSPSSKRVRCSMTVILVLWEY